MSWLIVVGVVVAVAFAVHLGEQARARRVIAGRRAERAAALQAMHRFTWVREIEEKWSADLELFTLTITRSEAGSRGERSFDHVLERAGDGAWSMKGADETWLPIPEHIQQKLETQYQRHRKNATPPA